MKTQFKFRPVKDEGQKMIAMTFTILKQSYSCLNGMMQQILFGKEYGLFARKVLFYK